MGKFSDYDAATLDGSELMVVSKSGATKRTTAQDVANLAPVPTTINLEDTNGSHDLILQCGEDLTGDRTLDLSVGDANAALEVNGNCVLNEGTAATLDGTETLSAKTLATLRTSKQTLTGAGAVDLVTGLTELVTTGANSLTLADGANGQIKIIVMITDGGDGTLTPAHFANGTTITFNDTKDSVMLIFLNAAWYLLSNNGCTVA